MYCSKCGALNEDQTAFCAKCGASLKGDQQAKTTTAAMPITVSHAGFWKRLGAAFLDGLVLNMVVYAIVFIFSRRLPGNAFGWPEFIIFGYPLIIVINWLYFALMESSSKQATLGKMALGIIVTDMTGNRVSFSRASGRFFGRILSAIILYIGFIMIAFTAKKQGLHDMLANTIVVNK